MALVTAAVLGGCSKSSGTSSTATTTTTASTTTLSGVAAVGAAIVGGTVSVTCSGGAAGTTSTSATGAYTMVLPNDVKPPCMVRVTGGNAGAAASPYVLHSFATTGGTVNITPLTELIVARASTLTPTSVYNGYTPGLGVTISSGLIGAQAYVRAQLANLKSVSVPTTDFIGGAFAVGDNLDKVLDALATALQASGHTLQELIAAASAGTSMAPLLASGSSGGSGGGSVGTALPQWGTLTTTGVGLPAGLQTSFTPNALPIVIAPTASTNGTVTWRNVTYAATDYSATTNQTAIATFTSANALVSVRVEAPTAGLNGAGTITCAILPGCAAITFDSVARTITFSNASIVLGAITATLNGTLRYSDTLAAAATTMTTANLATCPTNSSNQTTGEPDASSLACLGGGVAGSIGVLAGITDVGNPCTLSVDPTGKQIHLVADNFDNTIGFLTDSSSGTTFSNLLHSTTGTRQAWLIKDPLVGAAATYRGIAMTVDKLAGSGFTVRGEGTVRSTSHTGTITLRGACNGRLP